MVYLPNHMTPTHLPNIPTFLPYKISQMYTVNIPYMEGMGLRIQITLSNDVPGHSFFASFLDDTQNYPGLGPIYSMYGSPHLPYKINNLHVGKYISYSI